MTSLLQLSIRHACSRSFHRRIIREPKGLMAALSEVLILPLIMLRLILGQNVLRALFPSHQCIYT